LGVGLLVFIGHFRAAAAALPRFVRAQFRPLLGDHILFHEAADDALHERLVGFVWLTIPAL
jgi:hypothetical protein